MMGMVNLLRALTPTTFIMLLKGIVRQSVVMVFHAPVKNSFTYNKANSFRSVEKTGVFRENQ